MQLPTYHNEDYADLLHPVQVLKNYVRLIHGSVILDHIRTLFLGGEFMRSNLYASIYGNLSTLSTKIVEIVERTQNQLSSQVEPTQMLRGEISRSHLHSVEW